MYFIRREIARTLSTVFEAQLNDNNAGVYGAVLTAGEVSEGAPVYLED